MATKVRLQRKGRKRRAIYDIVAIDSRVKRDGKSIESLGQYNPNTHPASVKLNFDRALYWVKSGAELSDTAKTILSDCGVLLKNHLDGGVKKGAFDQATADKKFDAWLNDKGASNDSKAKAVSDKKEADEKKMFAAETKIKEDRAAAIVAKNAPLAEEVEAVAEAAEEVAPAVEAEVEAPAAVVEEVKAEEAPVAEKKEEKTAE